MERACRRPASSPATRMTSDDQSILHLVNPIAELGDYRIVGHEKQRFASFLHDSLQQLEGAARIFGVEISGRFVGQDHVGIIRQRARDRHALLFAAGKMPAGTLQFAAQAHCLEQVRGAFAHFVFASAASRRIGIMTFSCAVKSSSRKWN